MFSFRETELWKYKVHTYLYQPIDNFEGAYLFQACFDSDKGFHQPYSEHSSDLEGAYLFKACLDSDKGFNQMYLKHNSGLVLDLFGKACLRCFVHYCIENYLDCLALHHSYWEALHRSYEVHLPYWAAVVLPC